MPACQAHLTPEDRPLDRVEATYPAMRRSQ